MSASSFLSPELALLLQAAGAPVVEPPRVSIDWDETVRLALHHRLYPRIQFQSLGEMPAAQAVTLRTCTQANAIAALNNLRRTGQVAQLLLDRAIEAIVLKGPLLSQTLYGDVAARVAGDIDLLVPEDALFEACQALLRAGFQPETPITPRSLRKLRRYQHDVAFFHPVDGTTIELHADIAQPHYGYQVDLAAWFRSARTVQAGDVAVKQLDLPHHYLLAGLHASKHRWHRLDLLGDIAAFNRRGMHAGLLTDDLPPWLQEVLRLGEGLASHFWSGRGADSGRVAETASQIVAGKEYGRLSGLAFDLRLRPRWPENGRYVARRFLSAMLKN
jgi:hypothetical protein